SDVCSSDLGWASEAFSYTGAKPRQGPHQGAQKSTITIAFPLTVCSKLSWVRSTVGTRLPFEKWVAVYSRHHVCRPVRAFADRAAALRLAGRGDRELARCARGSRTLAAAHRRPRLAAHAARRRRRHPAQPGAPGADLGRPGALSELARRTLRGRAAPPASEHILVRLHAPRDCGFGARPRRRRRADLSRNLPRWPAGGQGSAGIARQGVAERFVRGPRPGR